MAWALVLVVAIGVGLPVAAWSITRRLPPPSPARRAGRGYDAIDRWLADRYQLAWRDRSRVRTAVFQGRPVGEPHLAPAAHGLAARVLAGRFRALRWSRVLGWADLGLGIGLGATGVVWLSTRGHPEGVLLPCSVWSMRACCCARGRGVPGRSHGGSGATRRRPCGSTGTRNSARPRGQRRAGRARARRLRPAHPGRAGRPHQAAPGVQLAAGCVATASPMPQQGAAPCRQAGKVLMSTGWKLATRRMVTTRGQEFGHLIGEGIAEPARGRYMVDFGSFAELHAGGTTYGRRSGPSVQVMHPMPDLAQAEDVLWLQRLLPSVTGAAVQGTGTLHGTACRRLPAHVDMQRAPAATEGGLRPPPVERFEQLRALPLTAWINGQYVRRIRFEHGPVAGAVGRATSRPSKHVLPAAGIRPGGHLLRCAGLAGDNAGDRDGEPWVIH